MRQTGYDIGRYRRGLTGKRDGRANSWWRVYRQTTAATGDECCRRRRRSHNSCRRLMSSIATNTWYYQSSHTAASVLSCRCFTSLYLESQIQLIYPWKSLPLSFTGNQSIKHVENENGWETWRRDGWNAGMYRSDFYSASASQCREQSCSSQRNSVRPSVCHIPVFCPDGWRYDRAVFSIR